MSKTASVLIFCLCNFVFLLNFIFQNLLFINCCASLLFWQFPWREISVLPVQWHALALGLFSSIISPFGGFFASSFQVQGLIALIFLLLIVAKLSKSRFIIVFSIQFQWNFDPYVKALVSLYYPFFNIFFFLQDFGDSII